MDCFATLRVKQRKRYRWRDEIRLVPFILGLCLTSLAWNQAFAAEVIPPKPDRYFNDYAHIISQGTAERLNQQLAQFERDTSTQVVVAIYPKMQSDSDIADYTRRVAQSWGVGQKTANNGVVLFVLPQRPKDVHPDRIRGRRRDSGRDGLRHHRESHQAALSE